jgi:hypothetical protein
MRHDPNGPADTSMMGIVHSALRRDLQRSRAALSAAPFPQGRRRAALAAHLGWMMDFLRAHHAAEDAGLYPMIRAKNPTAADLLDTMDADHHAIDPAVTALHTAADQWGRAGAEVDREAVVTALDQLLAVLTPHLEREEAEAMPVVSATITHRQWHEWDQTYNIKPKSLPVLAEEGLWLMEGLDEERRQVVLHEVPLVPRLIVLYGFGPRYRRKAAARWSVPAPAAVGADQ